MPAKSDPRGAVPPSLLLDGPNPFVPGHTNEYGPNGYVTLEFKGPQLFETIHLPGGTPVLSQEVA
jgi:hypothetical protein